jgi:hypothetical protein
MPGPVEPGMSTKRVFVVPATIFFAIAGASTELPDLGHEESYAVG